MSMTSSISMRRIGVVIAATVLLAACNDGDVSAPAVVQDPGPICDQISLPAASENGSRTCVWSIEQEGAAGEVIAGLDCGDGDCPGTFFCAAATSRWTPQSQICPDNAASTQPAPAGQANIFVTTNDGLPNEVSVLRRPAPVAGAQNPPYVLDEEYQHNSRENQGAGIDASGNLVHVGDGLNQGVDDTGASDGSSAAGLITACEIGLRGVMSNGNEYDGDLDRQIRGAFVADLPPGFDNNPGMSAPKGLLIGEGRAQGLSFVADFGNSTVRAFGMAASGNQSPVSVINTPAAPWDVAYDEARDILYVALTTGSVARYNSAAATLQGGTAPSLTGLIGIQNGSGATISSNLHGIVYEPVTDSLVISDVGPATTADDGATFNSDGSIYVLRGISATSNGNVQPDRIITGSSTRLGNPVDIVLSGRDLVVAEKANGAVLFFNDVFVTEGTNVSPSDEIDVAAPESLAFQPVFGAARAAVTDFTTTTVPTLSNLLVSRSTPGNITIERRDLAGTTLASYTFADAGTTSQNIVAGLNGEAYVTTLNTSDMVNGPFGGVLTVNGFVSRTNSLEQTDEQDRRYEATQFGGTLAGPRGFDIDPNTGLLFVADLDSGTIKVVSACGGGALIDEFNVAAVSHDDMGNAPDPDPDAAPWDVDFDPATGDLYVAMVNGNVAVFRSIAVADGNDGNNNYSFTVDLQVISGGVPTNVGTNLHGVEYVPGAGGGFLILSDVGDAGVDNDGALYVLNNVGSLGTTAQVSTTITGGNTRLGNPVDIAFDGTNLYVAEKANAGGQVLRFDGILGSAGGDIAPNGDFSFAAAGAESISLTPDYVVNP